MNKKSLLFRILGIFLILVALACFVVGIMSFESNKLPDMPFLLPIGIFVMFGAIILTIFGFSYKRMRKIQTKMEEFKSQYSDALNEANNPVNQNKGAEGISQNTCSKCGFVNPPDAKFCNKCGATLTKKCPYCGAENDDEAKYCKTCGKLL